MNFLNSFFKHNKESVYLDQIFARFDGLREDDVFLIGYPKSGNTWVRFLIGNYLSDGKCDFTNSHLYVPGLIEHVEICNGLTHQRFMSTHFSHASFKRFLNRYLKNGSKKPKIIFIARDGRDVAVSYYYHLIKTKKIPGTTSFKDFVPMFNNGQFNPFQSWNRYTLDWLNHRNAFDFLVIRYDQLLADTNGNLRKMLEFAGIEIDSEKLNNATAVSSFDNMKNMEKSQSHDHFRLKDTDSKLMFVRQGGNGTWEKEFDDECLQQFYKTNNQSMQMLGYEK